MGLTPRSRPAARRTGRGEKTVNTHGNPKEPKGGCGVEWILRQAYY